MSSRPLDGSSLSGRAAGALALAGCTNPDAPSSRAADGARQPRRRMPASARRPRPRHPRHRRPADVQPTPPAALTAFAELYINWSYQTLTARAADTRRDVGRRGATGRAAGRGDQRGGHDDRSRTLWNSGQIVSIAPDHARPGTWVIVTREQTGGYSEYEGLPAAYHVTLARLARVPGGFAVSEWLPQS